MKKGKILLIILCWLLLFKAFFSLNIAVTTAFHHVTWWSIFLAFSVYKKNTNILIFLALWDVFCSSISSCYTIHLFPFACSAEQIVFRTLIIKSYTTDTWLGLRSNVLRSCSSLVRNMYRLFISILWSY